MAMEVVSYAYVSLYNHEAFSNPGDVLIASPPFGSKITPVKQTRQEKGKPLLKKWNISFFGRA